MINGVITDYIHINDRALNYGDGLFETVLYSNDKLYYWKQHYQRLKKSAQILDISCPDEELLLDDIRRLLDDDAIAGESHGALKIILSRGTGDRGYRYSDKIMTNRFIMNSSLKIDYSSLLSENILSGDLFLCKTQVSINESLAGIKHLNRLDNVLAHNEWSGDRNKNYIDGLMLNAEHLAIECTMSNIFAVDGDQLITPDLKRSGVRGIMRDQVIDIATDCDLKTSVCDIDIDELSTMDELFITNSLIGLKSVTTFNDNDFNKTQITKRIFDNLLKTKEKHVQKI